MIYRCEDCGFLFRRTSEVQECPLCERKNLRFATTEEEKQLQILLEYRERNMAVNDSFCENSYFCEEISN